MERQRIEKEINEVCLLEMGFRSNGLHATVSKEEKAHLAKWKSDLQSRRLKLMTAEEIAFEASLPF